MSFFINAEGLKYSNLINNIDFQVRKNEFIAISGSNNSGKTTLIKVLSKKLPTKKSVLINNKYIEEYNIIELKKIIGTVIYSDNNIYREKTVEEELLYLLQDKNNKRYNEIVKLFKLNKYKEVNPNDLDEFTNIKLRIAKEIILKPKILLLDDICLKMTKKEKEEILDIIEYLKKEEKMTIIMSTQNLEDTLNCDYIYILSKGNVELEGTPMEVLEKDNILNRLGLEVPFMIDLSVKLRDYDLIKDIELDMDRMVDILWK
ncbi:MAG: ATP-binding cassette domain-containing protein [Firmicutes bacterium]|nr:ATP-binding cassette domain-containing protein [Bacillota bacterium]